MDTFTSSHDAAVDCDIFLSEYLDDGTAARKRSLLPKACLGITGCLEDGQGATAATTCGDGACSLHSLWGDVIRLSGVCTYFCEGARQKLCEAMPLTVNAIFDTACGPVVRVLLDNMCSDLIGHVMRKTREEPLMPGQPFGFFRFNLRKGSFQ